MSARRKKGLWQIGVGVILLLIAGVVYWRGNSAPEVSDFISCAAAGHPVMESYPRQCRTPEGETFREDIGNELEKDDLIRLGSPRPNATVASPLAVRGAARGGWFFEASFPIVVVNWDGKIIGEGYATAEGEWTTPEFVPFSGTIKFDTQAISGGGYSNRGTLILKKANASGLPEHDDALEIPVVFQVE